MARASRHRHPQSPLPYFLLTNPADPEAEYQLQHYVAVDISLFVSAIEAISGGSEYLTGHYGPSDISRRELSAPAGAQYLCRSGDGSLNVRTNHRERFHTKTGSVEHPPAFPRPVIGADRQRWHPKRRPVGRIGEHASPVPIVPVHEIAFLDAAAFRTGHGRIRAPIVLEYVGRTRRSMQSVRRNVNGSGPAPSASLRDTTRQWQPSRPSGFRKIAWPPTRKQNINPCMMHGLIFPVVSFPLRPVRVIRRPFPVVPCPIADCRLSAFARRPAAWNVLHPTWRGREGVLWRMGKAGTVWRRASQCAVSWFP